MTDTRFLKPAGAAKVALEPPAVGDVPEAGVDLPLTRYYRRRIAEGSLVEVRRPAAGKTPAAPEKPDGANSSAAGKKGGDK